MLVVIAIIAILAAIIFPVYARAKDAAFRSDDMAAMNQLRTALQLYYNDQGAYPPQLLGYVTLYATGPNAGNVIPANELQSYLYPRRVGSLNTFTPAYNKHEYDDTTPAVYPNQDPRAIGTAPVSDLDGDGDVDGTDDIAGARQAYGPTDGSVCLGGGVTCPANLVAQFYAISGYDVARIPLANAQNRVELRYTLFWTDFALNQNGNAFDDPRQLGYGFPPDDTIVTWNSYFREVENGVPQANNREILLFLGGSARPASSRAVFERSWRYEVNP
jgi:type II secretory pathway pseudopilin PulG